MNKGISLIELLVTIASVGIMTLVGFRFYTEQKKSTYTAWAKVEMSEISKVMKTAKSYDGYYHQFIYAMGYQPKGKIYASVGTDAGTSICCDKYPDPGTDPCKKAERSGFLYYSCGNSATEIATDNIEICDSAGYSNSCQKETGLSPLQTSDFATCPISPADWCNCDQFTVGAITHLDKELTIDHVGTLCLEN